MKVLLLPVLLPVVTVLLAATVQRRFGHRLGGRLVGLPMTTFPFLLALLMLDGVVAAAQAARGMAAGQLVVAAFCLSYGRLGRWLRHALAAVAVALVVAAGAFSIASAIRSTWVAAALVGVVVLVGLATWPPAAEQGSTAPAPRWETLARVLATTAVVLGLTAAARLLGPHVAGLLACAPVVLSVLAPTTHRRWGFPAARTLVHGTLRSLPGTLAFGVVTAYGLMPLGPIVAISAAGVGLFAIDHLAGRLLTITPDLYGRGRQRVSL
jgi:hypothetical protein